MKKASEILKRCIRFEQLASYGIEPISFEHPTIPRAPLLPVEFRPTEMAAPATIPAAQWDVTPTERPPVTPTMRSPGSLPEVPDLDIPTRKPVVPELDIPEKPPVTPEGKPPVTPEGKPPVTEQKPPATDANKPAIKASDIKFDENGEVVVPKEWYNEKGKLVVDKQQLAKAIYDARRAKIVGAKIDAARAKTLTKEMNQVNSMVKGIAFREKLPARAAIALASAAALTAAYFVFSGGKQPQTVDPIKKEVVTNTSTSTSSSSIEKPSPANMSAAVQNLKVSLTFLRPRSPQEKAAIQSYSTLLDTVNSTVTKLSSSVLNLDSTQSAASYAAQLTKFDQMAVDAVTKLEKLETIFKNRNDNDGFEKAKKVIDGLEGYIVAINAARSIRSAG